MKRKLLLGSLLVLLTFSALFLVCTAEGSAPKVSTYAYNLVFDNQVYIEYAVKVNGIADLENADIGVLIWREGVTERTAETAAADLKPVKTVTLNGNECYVMKYTDLSAKEMTDTVYSQPYVRVNGQTYTGDVKEYSICTYAERMLGLAEGVEGTTNETLRTMLLEMLQYGTQAQRFFGYRTDRLANAILEKRVSVSYEGIEDGSNPNPGTLDMSTGKVKLLAPTREGYTFRHWCDVDNEWAEISEIDLSKAGTVHLSAIWDLNRYSITYKNTMGMIQEGDLRFTTEYTVLDVVNQPQALEKYDYKFNGWRIGGADGDFIGEDGLPVGTTGDLVLYADWTLKEEFEGFLYTVDENYRLPNGQKLCILTDVTLANDITRLEIPSVFNYISAGVLKYFSSLEELTLPFLGSDYTGEAASYLGYVFGTDDRLTQNDWIPATLTKVTVNGSGKIGANAFRGCTNLVEIVVSGTSTEIGQNAYLGCTSLVSLTTPVYYIDGINYGSSKYPRYQVDFYYGIPGSFDRANQGGKSYTEANLAIPRYNFETLHINGGTVWDEAFYQNLGIKNLIIEGVEVIKARAFMSLKNMETLTLHEGLKQIQDSAFQGCNNPKFNELIIPDSVTKLGGIDYVRMGDSGNVWYEGPAEASDFREGPFQFCGYLTKIVIGDGVEAIPSACFNRTNVDPTPELELTLGKNVRMIGPLAFYGVNGVQNETDCRISKIINNSVHKEMIVYYHSSSETDIGTTTLLNALNACDNPPEKIYLGNSYKENYDFEKETDALKANGLTVEQALSYKFEIVVYSYYDPYETGKAVDGLTYWHMTDPYFWITKQYHTPVMWVKPQEST